MIKRFFLFVCLLFFCISSVQAISNETFECVDISYNKNDGGDCISNVSFLDDGIGCVSASSGGIPTHFVGRNYVLNHVGMPFTIFLKDVDDNPLAGQTISIIINGCTYSRTIKTDGSASININLPKGNYLVSYSYGGNSVYSACNGCSTINVVDYKLSSSLLGSNIVKYFDESASYKVFLKDNNGNVLAGESIVLNINGVSYNRIIQSDGSASLSINLPAGSYTVSVSYAGNSYYYSSTTSNSIIINRKATYLSGNNLTKFFGDPTPYIVQLKDYQNNLMNGRSILININGETYTRTTNANGQASLNINLPEGIYMASSVFNGDSTYSSSNVFNSIIVVRKTTNIISSNLIKYYDEIASFNVQLVDYQGNSMNNRLLTFNVNGENYTRITDGDGRASLSINLPVGTYIITITHIGNEYYCDCIISNIITVNKKVTNLIGNDLTKFFGDSTPYTIQLKDFQGNNLNNCQIQITINGCTYLRTTNNEGQVTLNINLREGIYMASSVFNGNEGYFGSNITNTVIIIRKATNIISNDLIRYFDESGFSFNVQLVDCFSNPLDNRILLFNIDGINYTSITNSNGFAAWNIDLFPGIYNISIIHIGNEYYDDCVAYNTININKIPTLIWSHDLNKSYGNTTPYVILLKNNDGAGIPYVDLNIFINNKTYIAKTNSEGYVFFNITLLPGEYNVTTLFNGNEIYLSSKCSNKIIIYDNLLEYTVSIKNYFKITNVWRLVPDNVIDDYLIAGGAGAIIKLPISRYLNIYTHEKNYNFEIFNCLEPTNLNQHENGILDLNNDLNVPDYFIHFEGSREILLDDYGVSKIIITYTPDYVNLTFRSFCDNITRFSVVYAQEKHWGFNIDDFEEVDFIMDGQIKCSIAFSNPIDFDEFGLRYALAHQNVGRYPYFYNCPYNMFNNYEYVRYVLNNEYIQYTDDFLKIASFPLIETIETNFRFNNNSVNKKEKISFGTEDYDSLNGFEVIQTFTIANCFIEDNDVEYFLNYSNNYSHPIFTASYGTFLLGLNTIWSYDNFTRSLAEVYNLTINRNKSAVVLSGVEFGGNSYIHCLNPEMGLSKIGIEENIFLFNFISSVMLSFLESEALKLCGHMNISASFENLFLQIISFENFTVFEIDNYIYIMLANCSDYIFKIDMETGLVWDLFNINNFTYKGVMSDDSYCFHDFLTFTTHYNFITKYQVRHEKISNEYEVENWSNWLLDVTGDILLVGSASMSALAIETLLVVGCVSVPWLVIGVAVALGISGVACKYFSCSNDNRNFLEESMIGFVTSLV